MGKELEGLEECLKAKILIDSLRETFKKAPNWTAYMDTGFKNSLPSMTD